MRRVRVLVADSTLDAHNLGAKVIAKFLQENGYEVVYTALDQSPERVVSAALQEAVDAIGISVRSGSQCDVFPEVMDLLKEKGLEDVVVFGVGAIPAGEVPDLRATSLQAFFQPGTPLEEILRFMRKTIG
jgi:methylmalonyl-CoA mutase C-terminal domain/subunit